MTKKKSKINFILVRNAYFSAWALDDQHMFSFVDVIPEKEKQEQKNLSPNEVKYFNSTENA